jgi:hypothetical protein
LDIGAQLTSFLRVTGATGVTSFGTNYNGPRFLIFAGAVLLTHSATLVLPGAANITTAANDALIAIPISGGWQVVAYTKATGIPAIAGPLASSGITGAAASGANSDITSLASPSLGGATATTQAASDSSTKIASTAFVRQFRQLAQTVTTQVGTIASGTTTFPQDNTIPQNTEGDQYMALAITPTNASSTLEIEVTVLGASTASSTFVGIGLFQDSTANAISAAATTAAASTGIMNVTFRHVMTAGTTSATTFKVRAGRSDGGLFYFNGNASAVQMLGGINASRITIKEYLP